MDTLKLIRGLAEEVSAKANVVQPMSYLSPLYPEDKTPEIILVYKEDHNKAEQDITINREPTVNHDDTGDFEVAGNPLEDPFDEFDADTTEICDNQNFQAWQNSEENNMPLLLADARWLSFRFAEVEKKQKSPLDFPDIWILTKTENSDCKVEGNQSCTVLVGLRRTSNALDKSQAWFSRSRVTVHGVCGIDGPQMDPALLKNQHLNICTPNMNVQSKVVCTYKILGRRAFTVDVLLSERVSLEVEWRQPKLKPPVHEAKTVMIVEAPVGTDGSSPYPLWTQLWTLSKLSEVLSTAWREKRSIESLPRLCPQLNQTKLEPTEEPSVVDRLQALFDGGNTAFLKVRDADRVPWDLSRLSIASGQALINDEAVMKDGKYSFQGLPLEASVEKLLSNKRVDSDVTDDLWTILSECESYKQLSNALDMVYRKINQGHWKPYIRHKNQSRLSYLLQTLCNAENKHILDLSALQGSGVLYAAEIIFELGLEKLSLDYIHIFVESGLAARDEITPPPFPRKELGVSQDAWLESCKTYLLWIARMHAAVEVVLLAEKALVGVLSPLPLRSIASQALSYFQRSSSPVLSASSMCSFDRSNITLRATISSHLIDNLLSQNFDTWQLTLTSTSDKRRVESVFHRSYCPIFPPQLASTESELPNKQDATSPYFCSWFLTIADKC